jgi:hypothetical protein
MPCVLAGSQKEDSMFVRVTPVRADASRQDAVTQLTNDVVIPLLSGLPGFRRYHACLDSAQGTGVAISYWETREQAQAVADAVRTIASQIQTAGAALGPAAIYEVVAEA